MTPFELATLPSQYEKVSSHQRFGQFLVNEFTRLYPGVLIPPEVDCFQLNQLIPNFLVFVAEHEYNNNSDKN